MSTEYFFNPFIKEEDFFEEFETIAPTSSEKEIIIENDQNTDRSHNEALKNFEKLVLKMLDSKHKTEARMNTQMDTHTSLQTIEKEFPNTPEDFIADDIDEEANSPFSTIPMKPLLNNEDFAKDLNHPKEAAAYRAGPTVTTSADLQAYQLSSSKALDNSVEAANYSAGPSVISSSDYQASHNNHTKTLVHSTEAAEYRAGPRVTSSFDYQVPHGTDIEDLKHSMITAQCAVGIAAVPPGFVQATQQSFQTEAASNAIVLQQEAIGATVARASLSKTVTPPNKIINTHANVTSRHLSREFTNFHNSYPYEAFTTICSVSNTHNRIKTHTSDLLWVLNTYMLTIH